MQPVLVSIVEGEGEVAALRPLIENIIASSAGAVYPHIMRPHRMHRGSLANNIGELELFAAAALAEAGPAARLLVLLDADDDCPAELGPQLRQRLAARFPDNPVSVNIADREYESWFIASAAAIANRIGAVSPPAPPDNIAAIRDAKGWVRRHLAGGAYRATRHQPSFSTMIDVPLARRRSPSFNRFCRELERLLPP